MLHPVMLSLLLLATQTANTPPAADAVVMPAGTPLWIQSDTRVPLRLGQNVVAHLTYSIYADNHLVLPKGTEVQGTIVDLVPDHDHRVQARLRADFTPFSRPVLQFNKVLVAGHWLNLPVDRARDGAPVLRLTPPPPHKGGLIRREWNQGVTMVKDRLRVITAPGKTDRLKQLLYSQLPYHPQAVPPGTVWTVDTTGPWTLSALNDTSVQPVHPPAVATSGPQPGHIERGQTMTVQAYLDTTLTSHTAKAGMPIRAVVAQPVVGPQGNIEIPEGSVLEGQITRARAARRFGRAGELRFDFRELTVAGDTHPHEVQTSLSGIDAQGGANLALDREGQVQQKPKDKIIVPLLLLDLAGRPLDRDRRPDSTFGQNAVASNSLGVLGFLVGTAGGWGNVAAGIGYYGSALAIYNRWIKRGAETTLQRNTRVVVQTTLRRSQPITGNAPQPNSR